MKHRTNKIKRTKQKRKTHRFLHLRAFSMRVAQSLSADENAPEWALQAERSKRKGLKGGGECKGPMCTICQECLTIQDDPKYKKYFDMLNNGEIKVVVQQKMQDDGLDQLILDYPDAPIEGQGPLYQHSCGSLFHLECIKKWCLIKKNADECLCPNCKQPIDFDSLDLNTVEMLKHCNFRKSNIIDAFIELRTRYNSIVESREKLIRDIKEGWAVENEKLAKDNEALLSHNRELRYFYVNLKRENEILKNRFK